MKVRFELMAQARHATGQTTVEVECAADATLLQALTELATRQMPALRDFVFSEAGTIHSGLMLIAAGDLVGNPARYRLAEAEMITLLTPLGGG